MDVHYEDSDLEELCTSDRQMRRRRADIADKLRLRVNALNVAPTLGDLVTDDPLGYWHPLGADLAGHWAGSVSRNHRLLIRPEGAEVDKEATVVTVVDIDDYH